MLTEYRAADATRHDCGGGKTLRQELAGTDIGSQLGCSTQDF